MVEKSLIFLVQVSLTGQPKGNVSFFLEKKKKWFDYDTYEAAFIKLPTPTKILTMWPPYYVRTIPIKPYLVLYHTIYMFFGPLPNFLPSIKYPYSSNICVPLNLHIYIFISYWKLKHMYNKLLAITLLVSYLFFFFLILIRPL